MQKILALALVATAIAAFPMAAPSFAAEQSASPMCGPDATEAYKRPGGYCEQVKDTGSLYKPAADEDFDFYILEIL